MAYPQPTWACREACHDPSWHMSANISSGAQLCRPQWYGVARSVLGYITPSPGPRGGRKDYANWFWPSKIVGGEIVFIWCNMPDLFNKNQGAAVHRDPSSAFTRWQDIMSACATWWYSAKDIWAARQNLSSINIRASSNIQHWIISQPGCGVRKTCSRSLLHSCCLWSLQGLLERPGFFAGCCSLGTPGVNGAHYEKHILKYPAYSLLSWKKRGFLIC